MRKQLRELAEIHYGKSPTEVLFEDGDFPIIGTGGTYGQARRAMFSGPAVVVPRKGSLSNPQLAEFPFWPVDTTYAVVPKPGIDARWLYYQLANFDLTKLNEATGVPSISRDWLSRLSFDDPGTRFQCSVAEVLWSIDIAIATTEVLIAKHQQIKSGLMNDLFTRGIDAQGRLRPPREEAPELYKPSPLGWIPHEWKVRPHESCWGSVFDFRGRTPLKLGMQWGGDVPALSAMNVKDGGIDLEQETYYGSELLYRRWMTLGDLAQGDVLLTMEAPLGNVAQVPDGRKYILSQRVIALRYASSEMTNDFAVWLLRAPSMQREMARRSSGTTATGIQRAELAKIVVPRPSISEQSLIADRLAAMEGSMSARRSSLSKLRQIKSGLMSDLLSGRVRVPA